MSFPRCFAALLAAVWCSVVSAAPLAEPWHAEYAGDDARGSHVLALVQFNEASADVRLDGAQLVSGGRFGGGLEAFSEMRKRHAALLKNDPKHSPTGGFSVEIWAALKPGAAAERGGFLFDKKYAGDTDYQMAIEPADRMGMRRIRASLGFGDGSETLYSEGQNLEPGAWHHFALTYDGAGRITLYLDGAKVAQRLAEGRKSIAAGRHGISIGDRVGSNYGGFDGYLDEFRLTRGVREFRRVAMNIAPHRRAYLRMEQAPPLRVQVVNLQRIEQPAVKVTATLMSGVTQSFTTAALPSGGVHDLELPIDTAVRPGRYQLTVRMETPGENPYVNEEQAALTVTPRPLPHRMPVLMWGMGGFEGTKRELPRLKDLGFTHVFGLSVDYGALWQAGKPIPATAAENLPAATDLLDSALEHGVSIMLNASPARALEHHADLLRVDARGKPYARPNVNGLNEKIRQYCYNTGVAIADTYGPHPAFTGALIHSEIRDGTQLSFSELDQAAYRRFAGVDRPAEVTSKAGVDYTKLKDFPRDRVIADDHPIRKFMHWFWTEGDGWNNLHTAVARGIHTSPRKDLWTFFDPAVRSPSIWGAGGEVDVLSQWTYSYPDPIKLGLPTDELFTMAAGRQPAQRVMKMTQIIWYRSQTAPTGKAFEHANPWDDHAPDAAFITIAPTHLREAFWTKISRPVQGVMYHGWGSLVETQSPTGYRFTHPETQNELRRLVKDIVQPLGPALMQVGDAPAEVAMLESFTSQMFTRGKGAWGWGNGWSADVYQALAYAQLQSRVLYEQTIQRDGLDGVKVLVMPDCDVLPRSVVDRILAFQKRGGIVIGDENLCPAITADLSIKTFKRLKQAAKDQQQVLALAADIRARLAGRFEPRLQSDNPLVVTRLRHAGEAEYVFAVNDHREFGSYVGQHGLVMENGLPSAATLQLTPRRAASDIAAVYDLVHHRRVNIAAPTSGRLLIPLQLGPGEGRVLLVTPSPIADVHVTHPAETARAAQVKLHAAVRDSAGNPIHAVVPLRMQVTDPDGREAEFSGYYGADGGRITVTLDIAANDVPGVWQVKVTELAGGHEAVSYMRVRP